MNSHIRRGAQHSDLAALFRWPDAKWYIMLDDDTYIFQQALAEFLQKFDPMENHYLGYPSTGVKMCREPTASARQPETSELFALGGCGMILSWGAMAALAPLLQGCMLSSQDCYLDDVRLYYCLKEAGISLNMSQHYAAMNFAPNSNIDWRLFDPCAKPVLFHGVSITDETKKPFCCLACFASTVSLPDL